MCLTTNLLLWILPLYSVFFSSLLCTGFSPQCSCFLVWGSLCLLPNCVWKGCKLPHSRLTNSQDKLPTCQFIHTHSSWAQLTSFMSRRKKLGYGYMQTNFKKPQSHRAHCSANLSAEKCLKGTTKTTYNFPPIERLPHQNNIHASFNAALNQISYIFRTIKKGGDLPATFQHLTYNVTCLTRTISWCRLKFKWRLK